MRLASFSFGAGPWRLGAVLDEHTVLDVGAAARALAERMPQRFGAHYLTLTGAPYEPGWLTPDGRRSIAEVIAAIEADPTYCHPRSHVKWGVPVPRPGKIIAAGRNYLDHVREGQQIWAARGRKVEVPKFPAGFAKFASSFCAHGDPIQLPPKVEAVDYEVELAVVIGAPAYRVTVEEALACVAGYTICNDLGARRIQMAEMEQQIGLVLSKNFPTFAPMGPWLVTADEIPDPQVLDIALSVNGEARQGANTRDMIFSVAALISHWSQLGLAPGDILSTGTPSGVAIARPEPERFFLRDGDEVRARIERIGELVNPVRGPA